MTDFTSFINHPHLFPHLFSAALELLGLRSKLPGARRSGGGIFGVQVIDPNGTQKHGGFYQHKF